MQHEMDKALAWDDRTENKGVENEGFTMPSPAIIEYAQKYGIQMNLWSRPVQRALRIRIQMEQVNQLPEELSKEQKQRRDWLHWQ
jgi:flagellar basal body-associated protein FliL